MRLGETGQTRSVERGLAWQSASSAKHNPSTISSFEKGPQRIMEATCPECAAVIEMDDDVMESEIIDCPDCGVELEVISLDPLTLDLAPEEEEDWGE
jgi:alpha-aminoadipate/glutamate carrier protein LysW